MPKILDLGPSIDCVGEAPERDGEADFGEHGAGGGDLCPEAQFRQPSGLVCADGTLVGARVAQEDAGDGAGPDGE